MTTRWKTIRIMALGALFYFLLAELGNFLTGPHNFSIIWPPSGFFLAYLLINPKKLWPWILLCAYPANILSDLIHHRQLLVSFLFCTGNCLEALVGAVLLTRFMPNLQILNSIKSVLKFIVLGPIIAAAVSATIGTLAITYFYGTSAWMVTWLEWWSGDGLSILLIAPLILYPPDFKIPTLLKALEFILILGFLIFLSALFFLYRDHEFHILYGRYLLFPFLILLSLHFKPAKVQLCLVLTFFTTCWMVKSSIPAEIMIVYLNSLGVFWIIAGITLLIFNSMLLQQKKEHSEKELYQLKSARNIELSSLGALAAEMSHEINNPLQIAQGYMESIVHNLKDKIDKENFQKILKINTALERISKMSIKLQLLHRAKALNNDELYNAAKIIFDVIEQHRQLWKNEGLTFNFLQGRSEIMAYGNPSYLEQSLAQVLRNARDALLLKKDLPKIITVTTSKKGRTLVIEVADNAQGIPPEIKDRIFELFFTTKSIEDGARVGLGLPIVRANMHLVDGSVSVDSTPGQGTVVTLKVPLPTG
ncbi:MAG: MASE1 domain-containing protein [Pseudomonadota bacterium]